MAEGGESRDLVRSLGLLEALTIGVGTMVGAGIFVLPGIILAKVGPAAVFSFLGGGVIALLAAMSAAEVATGMPRSGGGYYFVSRALGPAWGAIVGWGSWFGLIFASAFYMVGFGEYVGHAVGLSPLLLALAMTVALTGLNLVGTEAAGRAQNLIVAALLAVLLGFTVHGVTEADPQRLATDWTPFGLGAVWAGTATLFVSFCGFGEIASMAEEIRDPGRNLPRALLGSVIAVTILYCVIVLLAAALRPWEEAGTATLLAELASDLAGPAGRVAVLVAAVLATVSSANASIMSASRISFAMGRDRLVSTWLNEVHPRFLVPHRAVLLTGGLTLAVILGGNLELLAEAAGLLHLLLYGLICVACIVLRVARPGGYEPRYRVPFFPWVPIAGAAGCLAVSFFMAPGVVLSGLVIVAFSMAHFQLRARRHTQLKGRWPWFLRRGLFEPGLQWVERLGALADPFPVAVVALADPARGAERLRVTGAIVGPLKGEAVAVTVVRAAGTLDGPLAQVWQTESRERARAMDELAPIVTSQGGRVRSMVPLAPSVDLGLASAVEATSADLVVFGWPAWDSAAFPPEVLAAAESHLPAHTIVLKERPPLPAKVISLIVEPTAHGELARTIVERLEASWGSDLRLVAVVPEDAEEEAVEWALRDLEATIGVDLRGELVVRRAADSVAAAASEASEADLVAIGIPEDADLVTAVRALDPIDRASVLVVAAKPDGDGEGDGV